MKKIIILGAGSSADFGLPLANEIFSQADKVLHWKGEDRCKGLKKAIEETEKKLHIIFSNLPKDKNKYPPFEEVLTFIWNTELNIPGWMMPDIFDAFVSLMGLTIAGSMGIAHFGKKSLQENMMSKYKKFIESLINTDDEVVFISLNYDIILDSVLKDIKKCEYLDYGIPCTDLKTKQSYKAGQGYILKPHGSLNLAYCTNCRQMLHFEDNIFTAISNRRDWVICSVCKHSEIKPLIIPPLYNKEQFVNSHRRPFSSLPKIEQSRTFKLGLVSDSIKLYSDYVNGWINLHLKNVDEITIIGYSLPAYDYNFKRILLRGLLTNKNRSKIPINIITKADHKADIENIKKSYSYLAGPVIIKNRFGFYNYLCSPYSA